MGANNNMPMVINGFGHNFKNKTKKQQKKFFENRLQASLIAIPKRFYFIFERQTETKMLG